MNTGTSTLSSWRTDKTAPVMALAIFVAAAVFTVRSVNTMGHGMPMPGGWQMSMLWMGMPGQSGLRAVATFSIMWLAMMVTMMMPATLPLLLLYRRLVLVRAEPHTLVLCAAAAAAYLAIWMAFGMVCYLVGRSVAIAAMGSSAFSRLVPVAAGGGLVVSGLYQVTRWKTACLAHCRDPIGFVASHGERGLRGALRLGLHHGLYCLACCWALMVMQLVAGVMRLETMMIITTVITLERLAPHGEKLARVVGLAATVWGLRLIARSLFVA